MKPNFEVLERIRFIPCELLPTTSAVDDGLRVYVPDKLPGYLLRREILEGDSLNILTIQVDEEIVCRLLIPCAQNCKTLADPLRPGCRVLHYAAHFPDYTVAELAALEDVNIELADRIFYNNIPEPTIYIYSDNSVLLRRWPDENSPDVPFKCVVKFIRQHILDLADSAPSSALGQFRSYCAEFRIDEYFQAFMPAQRPRRAEEPFQNHSFQK